MPDTPCPAKTPRIRALHGSTHRRALFLLDHHRRLTGAAWEGQILSAGEASALWCAHRWEPVSPGQPWPMDTGHDLNGGGE